MRARRLILRDAAERRPLLRMKGVGGSPGMENCAGSVSVVSKLEMLVRYGDVNEQSPRDVESEIDPVSKGLPVIQFLNLPLPS